MPRTLATLSRGLIGVSGISTGDLDQGSLLNRMSIGRKAQQGSLALEQCLNVSMSRRLNWLPHTEKVTQLPLSMTH